MLKVHDRLSPLFCRLCSFVSIRGKRISFLPFYFIDQVMNVNDEQEIRYRLFKLLDDDPSLTQRQMAEKIGISLGKFNFCLKELVKKGFVKINRFTSSQNKVGD